MEVLLVEPPALSSMGNLRTLGSIGTFKAEMAWPPLDLMIISGLLDKHGISSEIFDANSLRATFDDVKKLIDEKKPRMVIFTTSTPTICHDLKVAEAAKQVSRDILTAVTSTHINARPKEALESNRDVDFAIVNDSESSFLNLIKADYDPVGIEGITYRQDGQVIHNDARNGGENLDDLGLASHHKIPLEVYRDPFLKKKPMTVMFTSRGCVNQPPCIMCSACFYNQPRYRSTDNVIEEMLRIQDLGIKEIRFPFEAGFNNHHAATELFKRMIEEKINLRFTCNGRADRLPKDILELMKEVGCVAINIGCESPNSKILDFCNKSITADQVSQSVENVRSLGMKSLVYFILGLPYETKQTMKETLDFAKKIKADYVTFGVAIPHPQTAFFNFLKEKGYLYTEDWNDYDPMGPPPYNYPDLSSEEIFSFARKAYRSYYLRPEYVLKRLLSGNMKEDYRNFLGFFGRYILPKRH